MPEEDSKNIIKELIAHINSLEEKIGSLNESITESRDLSMVNKLDIINLKNQTEKIKLSLPNISPDMIRKMRQLEDMPGGRRGSEKMKAIEKEIKIIKSRLGDANQRNLNDIAAGMEFINQRLDKFESAMKQARKKSSGVHSLPKLADKSREHSKAIKSIHKKLGMIEKKASMIKHCKKCGSVVEPHAKFCRRCGSKV